VAFTLSMGLFSQIMQNALLYQFHMHLATKCSDTLDNILLSFGDMPGVFGLGDYNLEPYTLDPTLVMKLLSASGPLVEYPRGSGIKYSNITFGLGDYLFVPVSECISYETAQELLGLKGLYGFRLSLTPIIRLELNTTEGRNGQSLNCTVVVEGFGSRVAEATVSCNLIYINITDANNDSIPIIMHVGPKFQDTNPNGEAYFTFDRNDDPNLNVSMNYVVIASARVANFYGVGYKYKGAWTSAGNVIPFVESITDGKLLLAHAFDVKQFNNSGALHYNASYFMIGGDWSLSQIQLQGEHYGVLNYGAGRRGKTYARAQIPAEYLNSPGILVVFCLKEGDGNEPNEYGVTVMPWMVQSLSFSVEFGGNPSGWEWVATDVRHVLIGGVPYTAKLALWSLMGYQVTRYGW